VSLVRLARPFHRAVRPSSRPSACSFSSCSANERARRSI
jgi:hypothetical protein